MLRLSVVALVAGALMACAGPTANAPRHGEACEPTHHEPATRFSCTYDSDCAVCHDGSACGTVMSRTEVARRGAACRHRDAAQCELSSARCCDGACVRSLVSSR